MRSHVAIAGIKEQAAAEDRANHQHGHGLYALPNSETKRFSPRSRKQPTPLRDSVSREMMGNIGMHRLHREMEQANKSDAGEVGPTAARTLSNRR